MAVNYIVDDIELVCNGVRTTLDLDNDAPYYMYGHFLEIANRLKEKDQDKVYKYQKYPLIALRMDIPETHRGDMVDYSLNIAIVGFTDKNYNAQERYTNVIKPVLSPIYEALMDELKHHFVWTNNRYRPEHVKIDRPFWGTTNPNWNSKYIFSDPLDAIEIQNLKITKELNRC